MDVQKSENEHLNHNLEMLCQFISTIFSPKDMQEPENVHLYNNAYSFKLSLSSMDMLEPGN